MLMIHIGVWVDELDVLKKQLLRFSERNEMPAFHINTAHDSWDAWGEQVVGAEALHVTTITRTPGRDIAVLAERFQEFLVPARAPEQYAGIRIALTDAEDFTVEYEEFRW